MAKSESCCVIHLKWFPCLGKHQRYDGEPCWLTKNAGIIDIVREVHAGRLRMDDARKLVDEALVSGSIRCKKIRVTPDAV